MNKLFLKAMNNGQEIHIILADLTGFVQANLDSDVVGYDSEGGVVWARKGDLSELSVEAWWSTPGLWGERRA